MLTKHDREVIVKYAEKYNASSVFLFGSSTERDSEANDIDISVTGVPSRLFFKFYAELIKNLSKNVDLIDLSRKSLFSNLVEKNGVKIYG